MAERVKQELISKYHVDLVVGLYDYPDIPNIVGAIELGEKAINA